MSKLTTLPVAAIEICDRVRSRAQKPNENSDIVREYAEAYECGLIVEPLDVFREKGTERYVVADGEHRLLALRNTKVKAVEVRLHDGDEIAALRFALGTNHSHGLRLTHKDRYYRYCRIKETPELERLCRTDQELSETLSVSIRQIKRYGVDWRNSTSSTQRAAKAKKSAAARAEKNTPASARTSQSQATTRPAEANNDNVIVPDRAPAAAEPQWTHADEHAWQLLWSAWSKATTQARNRLLAKVRE